ncbi:deoxyribodipyrimidine photo-lyase, putative [Plasmodium gallinaceum]|uniref:Deoxyribodipyrimidine photo-lyase n=1 Tax=Plasmodium gallinaceum TaxID=5849 RepID=A0A1J1GZN9_PLAGA|nr:deoxyribodipyrimidine photo-lyase, putative [Plasmodium gallinaceum]CRG97914.1 deoxyribodipyrimidine photo-lyase, putative [Plasmodium gallinaceum]
MFNSNFFFCLYYIFVSFYLKKSSNKNYFNSYKNSNAYLLTYNHIKKNIYFKKSYGFCNNCFYSHFLKKKHIKFDFNKQYHSLLKKKMSHKNVTMINDKDKTELIKYDSKKKEVLFDQKEENKLNEIKILKNNLLNEKNINENLLNGNLNKILSQENSNDEILKINIKEEISNEKLNKENKQSKNNNSIKMINEISNVNSNIYNKTKNKTKCNNEIKCNTKNIIKCFKKEKINDLNRKHKQTFSSVIPQDKENNIHSDEKKKKNPFETCMESKLSTLIKRVRCLTSFENAKDLENTEQNNKKNILLLLTRDFRVNDNWALIYAYEIAKKKKNNLLACTYLNRKEEFPERYIDIKLKVLKNLEESFKKLNIPFYLLTIYMIDEFMEFLRIHEINTIICDFHPLAEQKLFIENLVHLSNKKKIKVFQVDSHNIVPLWVTSKVEEYSARTIRPKIKMHLPTFLTEYIKLESFEQNVKYPEPFEIDDIIKKLVVYNSCPILSNFICTEKKAREILDNFCKKKLDKYNLKRNDPNGNSNSQLSPYLNFGIISSQRCVLEVNKYAHSNPSINTVSGKESFNEEIIIRKELADNFCYYNKNYDNFNGGKSWAKESLRKHDSDKREYLYDYDDFKNAKTHNDIWNCCQLQLIKEGIIHGYLRMYWAKKILNWSENSKTALKYAIKINDDFAIDGKSPNGYVGVMWSIMGVHDQGWNERNIFGKVRFMNYNGCKRKFDINMYMSKYPKGKENALTVQKIPTITFVNYLKKRKNNSIINEEKKKKNI